MDEIVASEVIAPSAWSYLLAFLERLGVDKMKAMSATIHIEADAAEGMVTVTSFVKNKDDSYRLREGELVTESKTYAFSRDAP